MNKYESVIIVNPNVDEEGIKALEKKFTDIINNDGRYTRYVNKKVTISGSLRVPDTLNWQRDIVLDNPSLQ